MATKPKQATAQAIGRSVKGSLELATKAFDRAFEAEKKAKPGTAAKAKAEKAFNEANKKLKALYRKEKNGRTAAAYATSRSGK